MKNKKRMILNILKYGFLFLFFLYALMISYNAFLGDTIVNYGFSYAIRRGEIPYNDFNLVLPLFAPLVYTISLIFTKNIICYYAFQSLLLVLFFALLEKLLERKVYLLLPFIFFGFPVCLFSALFPGYNFILLFLIVLLIYLEKKNGNDYLIGFIIGLSIITKHTIGVFLILPSLIYLFSNYKKVLKRIVGVIGPCFLFLIYLLVSNSFTNFLNLCVGGLFDFLKNNFYLESKFLLVVLILTIIYLIYSVIKRKKDISNYYVLVSILFIYPLIDSYHLSYFVLLVLILFLMNINIKISSRIVPRIFVFIIVLSGIWTFIVLNFKDCSFYNFHNYPLRYIGASNRNEILKINKYASKTNKNVVMFSLGSENYFYKIVNDLDITYFDLPNYGNYGYDSYKMMSKKFDELNDTLILINKNNLDERDGQQYYKELARYVIDNYEYVESLNDYDIYYKE